VRCGVSFSWQSEEMAELKDKLQSSFDALIDGLEIFGKKLAKVIEECLDLIGRLFTDFPRYPLREHLQGLTKEYSVRVGWSGER